ncbi:uncharacterized protein LOC110268426 [Arachis ipaensis]|uniref:uncharacterized protein LOC110268426 n=1 Tax=Arachis ipaensis TaxID=130454 RepID=UPI000A2B848B|nr:uncharacterized protein LOC110268426 [Arachis ipaensis]
MPNVSRAKHLTLNKFFSSVFERKTHTLNEIFVPPNPKPNLSLHLDPLSESSKAHHRRNTLATETLSLTTHRRFSSPSSSSLRRPYHHHLVAAPSLPSPTLSCTTLTFAILTIAVDRRHPVTTHRQSPLTVHHRRSSPLPLSPLHRPSLFFAVLHKSSLRRPHHRHLRASHHRHLRVDYAKLTKLLKNLMEKVSTMKNTEQILEQHPRVISSLDAYMDNGLQNLELPLI